MTTKQLYYPIAHDTLEIEKRILAEAFARNIALYYRLVDTPVEIVTVFERYPGPVTGGATDEQIIRDRYIELPGAAVKEILDTGHYALTDLPQTTEDLIEHLTQPVIIESKDLVVREQEYSHLNIPPRTYPSASTDKSSELSTKSKNTFLRAIAVLIDHYEGWDGSEPYKQARKIVDSIDTTDNAGSVKVDWLGKVLDKASEFLPPPSDDSSS